MVETEDQRRTKLLQRLDKYKRDSELLRQIHSNKAFKYSRYHGVLDICTVIVSTLLTFLGFTGTDRMMALVQDLGWTDVPSEVFTFSFNTSVFLILVLIILNLVFRFQDKALSHNRAIVILTGFRRDVDDLLQMQSFKNEEIDTILREVRERYKMITEILPPSTDKEFLQSKRDYMQKKRLSQAIGGEEPLRAGTSSANITSPMGDQEASLASLLQHDAWMMEILRTVREVRPDCWVSGGFVRNKVWDELHGYTARTPLDDVDVIYFDKANTVKDRDQEIEARLAAKAPNIRWSVKNQARMHSRAGDEPYTSLHDALSKWPETATAVAVSLSTEGQIRFVAPFGYADLFRLVVRPSPHFYRYPKRYEERLREKNWEATWPNLLIFHLEVERETP